MHRSGQQLVLSVVSSDTLSHEKKEEIIDLCTHAFEGDFRKVMDTFHSATHVLGRIDGCLLTHALWVTRWLQVGDGNLLRTAYVEAVATDKQFRRFEFAQAVMGKIVQEIEDFELGGLSPFRVSYYECLGWELWQGPLFIRTEQQVERSPEDEEVMIYRLPKTAELDLSVSLSAEWREGEQW